MDVIHTDAGWAGTTLNMGDADFYPNGGHKQPGCPFVNIEGTFVVILGVEAMYKISPG